MQKNCLVCGNTFDKKQNESKQYWSSKKYCSRNCSLKLTSVLLKENPWKGKKMDIETRKKISVSLLGHPPNSGSFKKGFKGNLGRKFPQRTGSLHHKWVESIETPCEHCGKTVERKPWQIKKHTYCDLKCSRAGIRGKTSPVFKGEDAKSSLRQRIMQLPEYVAWRKAVFSRDSFKCVWCGKPSGFEADHIISYKDVRDRNGIRTPEDARACAELWDVANGRTLCRECHRKTDSYPKNLLRKRA